VPDRRHQPEDRDTLAVGAHNHASGRAEAALSPRDRQAAPGDLPALLERSAVAIASNEPFSKAHMFA
jgi:hypothetical protein